MYHYYQVNLSLLKAEKVNDLPEIHTYNIMVEFLKIYSSIPFSAHLLILSLQCIESLLRSQRSSYALHALLIE